MRDVIQARNAQVLVIKSGVDDADTVSSCFALGRHYAGCGRHADAVALGERALRITLRIRGQESLEVSFIAEKSV